MSFSDYSRTPASNTTIGDDIYIGPNMERGKVRPALQQIAADGRELSDAVADVATIAAAAEATIGPTYASTAAGLAATAEGGSFAVDNGDGTVTIYREISGSAVEQRTLATTAALAAADGAELVGFTATGTGADDRTVAELLNEFVFASNYEGYDPTGVTPCQDAIMAADADARTKLKTLVISGTPLINETLLIDAPTHWRMEGSHMKPGYPSPGSRIVKAASLDGPAIYVSPNAPHSIFENVNITGIAGNGGDGWEIVGDGIRMNNCAVQGMGRDGFRIGSTVANPYSPGVNYNADHTMMNGCSASLNGRDGIHLSDESGIINANALLIEMPRCLVNGRDGIHCDKSYLGTTILAPSCELNGTDAGGYGIRLTANALNYIIVGGDIEGNITGDVWEAEPFSNRFHSTMINGSQYTTLEKQGSFTPSVIGSTGAGTATYTIRRGYYAMKGRAMTAWIEVDWSGHTGTGDLYVSGFPFSPTTADANIPNFVAASVMANGIALAAGAQVTAGYNHNANRVHVYANSGGSHAALPIEAAGYLSLTVEMAPLMIP